MGAAILAVVVLAAGIVVTQAGSEGDGVGDGQQVVAGPGSTSVPPSSAATVDDAGPEAPGDVGSPALAPAGPSATSPAAADEPDPATDPATDGDAAAESTAGDPTSSASASTASTAGSPSTNSTGADSATVTTTTEGTSISRSPTTASRSITTSRSATTSTSSRATTSSTAAAPSTTTTRSTTATTPATTATTTTVTTRTTATPTTTTTRPTTTTERTTTTAPTTTTTEPTTTTTESTTTTTTTSGDPSGTIIWQDDFDRFDTATWAREHSTYGDGNNELQCYVPDNVSVAGGRLILQARTETVTCPNGSTRQVSSGMVRSQGVTFSPGQAIEFRVKLTPADPNDQGGLWPAVWASGWGGGGWPAGGELDWLEVMTAEDPTRAMFSMHYADPSGEHEHQNQGVRGSDNFSAAWHTVRFDYGLDGELRWYLDGALGFAVDAADTLQGYPAPFDETIGEIKINLALGGRPGPLSPGAVGSTGATFEVDYIRIIQL